MARIVYAVPYTPPPGPPNLWPGMRQTWTGWDGSVWDLNGNGSGVWLRAGVRGMGAGPRARYTSESAAVAGSRWLGDRALERDVFWPATVYSDGGSQAWIDYNRAFMRTLHPKKPGTWSVTQPNGETRALRCRFVDDGDWASLINPSLVGFAQYGFKLVAEDPDWRGELITRVFESSDPLDFLPATGGPPFRISESSLTTGATIANPGDVDTWVEWWLTDTTSAVVGVGDRTITVPFALDVDRMLVIDTSPSVRTAIEIDVPPLDGNGNPLPLEAQRAWVDAAVATGLNRTKELGATKFGAVPEDSVADLSIALVGTNARARASIVPGYFRAF